MPVKENSSDTLGIYCNKWIDCNAINTETRTFTEYSMKQGDAHAQVEIILSQLWVTIHAVSIISFL